MQIPSPTPLSLTAPILLLSLFSLLSSLTNAAYPGPPPITSLTRSCKQSPDHCHDGKYGMRLGARISRRAITSMVPVVSRDGLENLVHGHGDADTVSIPEVAVRKDKGQDSPYGRLRKERVHPHKDGRRGLGEGGDGDGYKDEGKDEGEDESENKNKNKHTTTISKLPTRKDKGQDSPYGRMRKERVHARKDGRRELESFMDEDEDKTKFESENQNKHTPTTPTPTPKLPPPKDKGQKSAHGRFQNRIMHPHKDKRKELKAQWMSPSPSPSPSPSSNPNPNPNSNPNPNPNPNPTPNPKIKINTPQPTPTPTPTPKLPPPKDKNKGSKNVHIRIQKQNSASA